MLYVMCGRWRQNKNKNRKILKKHTLMCLSAAFLLDVLC